MKSKSVLKAVADLAAGKGYVSNSGIEGSPLERFKAELKKIQEDKAGKSQGPRRPDQDVFTDD